MKRVIITTGIFPPDIGGPATYIPRFGEFLSSNDLDVVVVTLSEDSSVQDHDYPFKVFRIRRSIKRWMRMIVTITQIAREMRKADLLFCNGLYLETALALRLSLFKGRSLVKIVGDPVWERSRNHGLTKPSIYGKIIRKLITWSLQQFDLVTTPGESLAKTVESWNKKISVKVVHNGVPIKSLSRETVKQFDLIVVSRLVPWKNIDSIIYIAKELDCSLAIVGDGPAESVLKNESLGYPDIVFLGARTNQEIINLLSKSRIFCQLSEYEGLSFSLLQAMSSALPCVVSDIQANKDVFDSDSGAAIFVNNKELKVVLREVSKLLSSPKMQKDLGTRARAIVKRDFDERDRMWEMMELLLKHD